MALLEVQQLHTYFKTKRGIVKAVNDVSFSLEAGQTLGIVGESGSGKSMTAMSILRLLDSNGYIDSGAIYFDGRDLAAMPLADLYHLRGNDIAMIFQEPMTSLNPVFTIERQLGEAVSIHRKLPKGALHQRVLELLAAVKIPNPQGVAQQYPHQLSGGMRQRVMIAMALSCQPKLLIADEPTTALDVTTQAQILKLMNDLKAQHGTSILFITHDLAVIRQMCDQVAVLYCGQVVEQATAATLFDPSTPFHPYTAGLMESVPRLDTPQGLRLGVIDGAVPHPLALPAGCKFAPRCKHCTQVCAAQEPTLVSVGDRHQIRCFHPVTGGQD